jgi:hypothetical protein
VGVGDLGRNGAPGPKNAVRIGFDIVDVFWGVVLCFWQGRPVSDLFSGFDAKYRPRMRQRSEQNFC